MSTPPGGTAPQIPRPDWLESIEGLETAPHPALAGHWSAVAAKQHASIAVLTRATLEWMALGIPADLLEEGGQAALDKLRHARSYYALASHYGGVDVGPGPLPLSDVSIRTDPAAILGGMIDEGCVDWTLSTMLLAEASERATDPVVRELLAQVAEDQQGHAELGWRVLAWMLDAYPEVLPLAVERFGRLRAPAPEDGPADLEDHGVLAPMSRWKGGVLALREVVLPAVKAIVLSRVA